MAMSFREIGEALGISAQNAYGSYREGMRKLRRKRAAMRRLRELAKCMEAERAARC